MQFSMVLQNKLYEKRGEADSVDSFEEAFALDTAIDLADGLLKGRGPEAIERVRSAYQFNLDRGDDGAPGWTTALEVLNELEAAHRR